MRLDVSDLLHHVGDLGVDGRLIVEEDCARRVGDLVPALDEFGELTDFIVCAANQFEETENLAFLQPVVEFEGALTIHEVALIVVSEPHHRHGELFGPREPDLPDREADKAHIEQVKGEAGELIAPGAVVRLEGRPEEFEVGLFAGVREGLRQVFTQFQRLLHQAASSSAFASPQTRAMAISIFFSKRAISSRLPLTSACSASISVAIACCNSIGGIGSFRAAMSVWFTLGYEPFSIFAVSWAMLASERMLCRRKNGSLTPSTARMTAKPVEATAFMGTDRIIPNAFKFGRTVEIRRSFTSIRRRARLGASETGTRVGSKIRPE